MVKIIETNLSLKGNGEMADHQSRVIEVGSWEEYINEYVELKTVLRNPCIGSMYGTTIPKNVCIRDLIYDNFNLSCTIETYNHRITKRLAYLIRE